MDMYRFFYLPYAFSALCKNRGIKRENYFSGCLFLGNWDNFPLSLIKYFMNQNWDLKGEKQTYCPPILHQWTKTTGKQGLKSAMQQTLQRLQPESFLVGWSERDGTGQYAHILWALYSKSSLLIFTRQNDFWGMKALHTKRRVTWHRIPVSRSCHVFLIIFLL